MGSSSRAARPAPLYTATHSSPASPSVYDSTPRSAGSMTSGDAPFSPTIYSKRMDSTASTASSASTDSYQSTSSENSRKVSTGSINANSYCGRHSDQYLFGGWGDLVKGVFHAKKN